MRKIKVRAWDSENKVMLSPQDLSQSREYWEWLGLGDYQLMQYIGIEDDNDKEIYEGDVCSVEYSDFEGKPCISNIVIKNSFDYHWQEIGMIEYCYSINVVGNVYEGLNYEKEKLL